MSSVASDSEVVASIERVTRCFGAFRALSEVDLRVERGDVYGLLGLNGAGKTTALRVLLRFLRPDSGSARVLGRDVQSDWIHVAPLLGATIEAPAFYPHLDGITNLRLLHGLAGSPEGRSPERAMELVGLEPRRGVRVRSYSQGMLQRLYIGQALLGAPQLLVLDEPTSNLDPRGILEVRNLIRRLRDDEGMTVILSSHQLSEVEDICNRVAILHRGRRLEEARVTELFGADQRWLEIEVDRPDKALECVGRLGWCEEPELRDGCLRLRVPESRRAELNACLVREGFSVSQLVTRRPSLEDYFHRVTADA